MPKVDYNLDFSAGGRAINLPAPSNPGDAVTKAYADAISAGLQVKGAVVAQATANLSLSAPGATIGGVTMSSGERVLLTGQTTGSQNGIWVWNGASSALTRPADFASGSTQPGGVSVWVESVSQLWTLILTSGATVTVDTTTEAWSQSNATNTYTAGNGLTLTSGQFALGTPVTVANGGTGAGTAPAARTSLGVAGKYVTDIGDGSTTSFSVNHGLGTSDVAGVSVVDRGTGAMEIADWAVVDTNHVSITFGTAPSAVSGTYLSGGVGKHVVVSA
ncbi:MAG: hypothetical protein JO130_18615 [Solirubrobacterales bacterium]|nr:hypothetical protein [Solirubrobacterales bacterium]